MRVIQKNEQCASKINQLVSASLLQPGRRGSPATPPPPPAPPEAPIPAYLHWRNSSSRSSPHRDSTQGAPGGLGDRNVLSGSTCQAERWARVCAASAQKRNHRGRLLLSRRRKQLPQDADELLHLLVPSLPVRTSAELGKERVRGAGGGHDKGLVLDTRGKRKVQVTRGPRREGTDATAETTPVSSSPACRDRTASLALGRFRHLESHLHPL